MDNDFGIVCEETGQYYYPHPYDPRKFIECRDGILTVYRCREGLHWNTNLGHCYYYNDYNIYNSFTILVILIIFIVSILFTLFYRHNYLRR
ncbi:Peritrophin-A domain containing protein [Alphaentomopoxvirus acuprea]|uniref:Peritrophin-A domain containing protein n=1 Tax=Alphaentomopoxvirus acuprea TaxID=62099 RepID=W6JL47_9POXV|nr:Peritrophin-A domain containing protein [Anomala cuprea entomopoxvirus]BAO49565.1 Peritrophin-A domain containing protein [Anomala cuprea entomopoxvirus]